ncbi:MAG: hypothetical protein OEZ36_09935, partial [Spirochaetota bacterium]|nr:hypothetical protein [Spirochaetota bacterium]
MHTDNSSIPAPKDLTRASLVDFLTQQGFQDIDNAYTSLKSLYRHSPDDNFFLTKLPGFISWLNQFVDKDYTLSLISQILAKSHEKQSLLDIIMSENEASQILSGLLSSEYLTQAAIASPDSLLSLSTNDLRKPLSEDDFLNKFMSLIPSTKADCVAKLDIGIVHHFKHQEIVRIGLSEIQGYYDEYTVEEELSDLASALFVLIYEREKSCFENTFGKISDGSLSIVALERLASRELSYKSPVNLLFVYEGSGKSDGANNLAPQEYYSQLANNIVSLFQPKNSHPLYPIIYPKKSEKVMVPLVYTVDDYVRHLELRELAVDRVQLTKARVIAGDQQLGEQFIKAIMPCVYKKYLSLSDINELKSLVNYIFKQFDWDSLRAIETTIQLFQLLRGEETSNDSLMNTISFIQKLYEQDYFSQDENNALKKEIHILKRLSHKWELFAKESQELESIDDFLPQNIKNNLLNHLSGTAIPGGNLSDIVIQAKSQLKDIFQSHFRDIVEESESFDFVTLFTQAPKEAEKILSQYVSNPSRVMEILKDIIPEKQKGRESLSQIMPVLLEELNYSVDSEMFLINFAKAVQSYNMKDTLYDLLVQNIDIFRALTRLLSGSQFLSEALIYHPELFEMVIDPSFVNNQNSIKSLRQYFNKILKSKPFTEAIFLLRNYEIFRLGLKRILDQDDFTLTVFELSNLAEFILYECSRHFYKLHKEQKGQPSSEVAIVLLGKLGGRELNFGSDLDIYFIYEREDQISPSYSNSQFYGDLIASVRDFFNQAGPFGSLYEIDLKLRPDGRNAPIIHSINKLEDYLTKNAAVWEKLAYTKARVLSGNLDFKKKLQNLLNHFVFSPMDPQNLKSEVNEMRKRIADNAINKYGPVYLF